MATKAKSAVPPVGHSGPSAIKARLLEVAARVRQVPGSLKDGPDLHCDSRVAFGPLILEAYEAGAWQQEGSFIGDMLRTTLTWTHRDRQFWTGQKSVPAWLVETAGGVIETVIGPLLPPESRGIAEVEWEAGILANEIEREADRIEASDKPLSEPLTGRAESVYQYIVKHGPVFGRQITDHTGIDQSTLTSRIIPELKRARGIVNKSGAGYYSPAHYSPK